MMTTWPSMLPHMPWQSSWGPLTQREMSSSSPNQTWRQLLRQRWPFLAALPKAAPAGALVCAAAAMNHYVLNHTTGQHGLQGFAQKVAKIIGLKYPRDTSGAGRAQREATASFFYAAAHPTGKRNMLYTLDQGVPVLAVAWIPGPPKPIVSRLDNFVQLRVKAVPAGAWKLYVTYEGCKRAAACGLLIAMPGVHNVPKLGKALRDIAAVGVGARVGVQYFTRGVDVKVVRVDRNSDMWKDLTVCDGAFLHIVYFATSAHRYL